jgi:hypothetical protein
MADTWTTLDMLKLGHLHADLEAKRELELLMATMVAEPSYEFHPLGRGMSGGERVRRYYAQFFEGFMQTIVDYVLIDEWANERAVVQEYDITVEVDGVRETHRVVGILFAEESPDGMLLGGERIYASERCVRQMAGAVFNEFEPIR